MFIYVPFYNSRCVQQFSAQHNIKLNHKIPTLLGILNGNVVFGENIKYGYLFSGKTTIIAPTGSEEGISEVSIKGKANILGTQKCGAILYLKNLEITQGSKVSVFLFVEI